MIDSESLLEIKEQIEKLRNQFQLFCERVKGTEEIEPKDKGPEDERKRIIELMQSYSKSLATVETRVEELSEMEKKADISETMSRLNYIDEIFYQIKQDIETITEEQYECKLGMFKQEMFNSIERLMESIDFVAPAIRNEIIFLEQKYRVPTEGENELEILQELVEDLEENRILLKEFFNGYKNGNTNVPGYNKLRCMGGFLSKYQYYENLPEVYQEIKGNFFEYCKALEPFLKDRKGDPTFAKFYDQIRDRSRGIKKMGDIFEIDILVKKLEEKVQIKYSYDQNIKNARKHLEKFEKRKKSLIDYNIPEINKAEKEITGLLQSEEDVNRFSSLMKEVRQAIKKRSIPFSQIESVFKKAKAGEFNILIGEQDVKDVSISITPHLEKKYGRGILERVNTIILEVDFWYPPGMKAKIFENISEITQKIQVDEPIDKQEFLKLMQNYDRELDQKVRTTYLDKIKDLKGVQTAISKLYSEQLTRKKLEQRLANKQIWDEVKPKMDKAQRAIDDLISAKPQFAKNIDKFLPLRSATKELCDMLYDLSMQLFILFSGVDGKNIRKMTEILSIFKESHDVSGLWASFSHYFKKNAIPNFQVNESIILQNARLPTTKAGLNKRKKE